MSHLTESATLQIESGLLIAISILAIIGIFQIMRVIVRLIRAAKVGFPARDEAKRNREIYTDMVELRATTDADRVCVFRFHNGTEFMPGNSAWKITCTHEVVRHGVTYESPQSQGILMSRLSSVVGPVLTGSSSGRGVVVADCQGCPARTECLKQNKRIVTIQVDEMDENYCKFHLGQQNVKTTIIRGMSINGGEVGFVRMDFCGKKVADDEIVKIHEQICKFAERIQYQMFCPPVKD
jgi:hypothetical protein